ncbi:MAG: hypothetical protein F4Y68_10445 [Boseongicola sp. SB0665_bin_10]|nr:hypothetical protein [Boseongicola sp. SB0665_bin_10]
MNISLELFEDSARFRYPPEHEACMEALDRLLDEREAGKIGGKRYMDGLQDLAGRHPWFIDAHAHVGNALLNRGRTRPALDAYLKGLALGEAAIPEGYADLIEWSWIENRPFFRAAHGAVLCHLHLRQWDEAIDRMNAMLALNPGDNQGIRYILGPAFLRAGRPDEARALLVEFRDGDPSLQYELGLLRLVEGKFAAAATSLRHGFSGNGYIAEMICGTPDPMPMTIWHGSGFSDPDSAKDYMRLFGDLWNDSPGATEFVRWLHTHPKVMAERTAVLECREALLWTRDVENRRTILDRLGFLADSIDDSLSDSIVAQRTDRAGNRVWPWLHAASCRRPD